MTVELNPDVDDFLAALVEARADMVIVGAYALAAHGLPRATGDIDILVRPTPDNAARVITALRTFGAPLDAHGVTTDDFEQPDTVYQIGLPPRRIDILTSISGVTFDEAVADPLHATLGHRTVRFIGRDALIRNKRATGRLKDIADADALESMSGG